MTQFIVKVLLNGIVVVPLLMWFSEARFIPAFVTALTLSLVAYFVGDQLILRTTNNLTATIADAVMTFAYLWIVAEFFMLSLSLNEMIVISLLVAVTEYFFHKMLVNETMTA